MAAESDKYILRSGAIDAIKRNAGTLYTREAEFLLQKVIFLLKNAPAADVAEVVPAQWEESDWLEYDAQSCETIRYPKAAIVCTNCRCAFKKEALWTRNFCPSCGAKMDGGNDNVSD
jgi:hypothetical protein